MVKKEEKKKVQKRRNKGEERRKEGRQKVEERKEKGLIYYMYKVVTIDRHLLYNILNAFLYKFYMFFV